MANQLNNIWTETSFQPILKPKDVHVWSVDFNVDPKTLERYWELLSIDEKKRVEKFRFKKDVIQFIVSRGVLRRLLGHYLNEEPTKITFQYGENGKPKLEDKYSLQFNLSHAGKKAVMGFVHHFTIGVDVELIKPDVDLRYLATRFFSSKESNKLLRLPDAEIPQAFYNCWTRKEAFIKAKGDGLSFPLDQFEVSFIPGEETALIATHWSPEEKEKWELFSFDIGTDYSGAVAIEGQTNRIKFFKWPE